MNNFNDAPRYISDVITIEFARGKVIDFSSGLVPASMYAYASVHNTGKDEDKGSFKSSIKINISDFSKGTGDSSVYCTAYVSVDTIYRLLETAREIIKPRKFDGKFLLTSGVQEYEKAVSGLDMLHKNMAKVRNGFDSIDPEKMKGFLDSLINLAATSRRAAHDASKGMLDPYGQAPDFSYHQGRANSHKSFKENGIEKAPVTELDIRRQGLRGSEKSNFPWYICIRQGIAPIVRTPQGTITYEAKNFKETQKNFMNVTDESMYRMMKDCESFIRSWESATSLGTIVKALNEKERIATEKAAAANHASGF